jgi:hypothetical protein
MPLEFATPRHCRGVDTAAWGPGLALDMPELRERGHVRAVDTGQIGWVRKTLSGSRRPKGSPVGDKL